MSLNSCTSSMLYMTCANQVGGIGAQHAPTPVTVAPACSGPNMG